MSSAKKGRKSAALNNTNGEESNNEGGSREREANEEFEPGSWECTVCTYRNRYEAFKCLMCDTRKGTSTRKPRLNPSVVQQQTLVQKLAVEGEKQKRNRGNSEARNSPDFFGGSPPSSVSSRFTPTPGSINCCPGTPTGTKPQTLHEGATLTTPGADQCHPDASPTAIAPPPGTLAKLQSSALVQPAARRRPIPFRDGLVLRSSAKKVQITVEEKTYTITELCPRNRKKRGNVTGPPATSSNSNFSQQEGGGTQTAIALSSHFLSCPKQHNHN